MAKPAQVAESAQLASSARDYLTFQPASSTCTGGPTRQPFSWPNWRSSLAWPGSSPSARSRAHGQIGPAAPSKLQKPNQAPLSLPHRPVSRPTSPARKPCGPPVPWPSLASRRPLPTLDEGNSQRRRRQTACGRPTAPLGSGAHDSRRVLLSLAQTSRMDGTSGTLAACPINTTTVGTLDHSL